jgi:hypothetical protein
MTEIGQKKRATSWLQGVLYLLRYMIQAPLCVIQSYDTDILHGLYELILPEEY